MSDTRRLVVSIDDQTLTVTDGGAVRRVFPVSTSIKGMGFTNGSYRTPTGLFRICEKIGAGHACGTIFKARVPVGQWQPGDAPDQDLVLTRILRLDGLESANANTLERCVYIHGTNREDLIGQPAGHGCVRLRNDDMIELFDMAATNDVVEIQPATRPRGALLFIVLDRVLTRLDGIVELARCRSEETMRKVSGIRTALVKGESAQADAWTRCMGLIRPDPGMCADVAARCMASLAPGAAEFIASAKTAGWLPVVLTDSPDALAAPVVRALGIDHCEAPPLVWHDDGIRPAPGSACPISRGGDMAELIMDWRNAMLPAHVGIIGDCALSQEIRNKVDFAVCVSRNPKAADHAGSDNRASFSFSDRFTWGLVLHVLLKDS